MHEEKRVGLITRQASGVGVSTAHAGMDDSQTSIHTTGQDCHSLPGSTGDQALGILGVTNTTYTPLSGSLHSSGIDRTQPGKLNKIVTHQKTCSNRNKQDTALRNRGEDRDRLATEKDQGQLAGPLIPKGLAHPVLMAPPDEDPGKAQSGTDRAGR